MGVWGMNTLIVTDPKLTDMMNDLNLVNLKADSAGVTKIGESGGQHQQVEITHWPESSGRDARSRAGDMSANSPVSLMTVPSPFIVRIATGTLSCAVYSPVFCSYRS